jgi:hypothetical protein
MDIPKEPIKTGALSSLQGTTSPPATKPLRDTLIADLRELNLQTGKHYAAKVVLSSEMQQQAAAASSGDTSDTAQNSITTAENIKKFTDLPALSKNEYLLRLNARLLLISSELPLTSGDKLLLRLDPNSSTDKPGLIAQRVMQSASATKSDGSIANPASLLQTGLPAPGMQSAMTAATISQLLQSLNLTLDKQIPLQTGLQQLSTLLQQSTASVQSGSTSIPAALRDALQQQLLTALPRAADIINTRVPADAPMQALIASNPSTPDQFTTAAGKALNTEALPLNAASAQMKAALLNSGLFLEQKLVGQPALLSQFKTQLHALQAQLHSSTMQDTTTKPALQHTLGQSLNKIQQTIEQLLQQVSDSKAGSTQAKHLSTSADSAGQLSDLKAGLISSAALVARAMRNELSEEMIKKLFMLPVAEDYTGSPFAFPLLATQQMQTAKRLFEKQEFTTGQILKLLAGMLHRLQFNQLHSLLQSNSSADSPLQQSWFFELPILGPQQQIHTFNFRIDRHDRQTESPKEERKKSIEWKLLLSFDLDALGPIYIQVKLQQADTASGHAISSVLWADQPDTVTLLQSQSEHFKNSLESLGLDVTELRCQQGQPSQGQTRLDRHLVDTKV